jgi:hypothetical protein
MLHLYRNGAAGFIGWLDAINHVALRSSFLPVPRNCALVRPFYEVAAVLCEVVLLVSENAVMFRRRSAGFPWLLEPRREFRG